MSSTVSSANATGLVDGLVITDRALANGEHLQAVSLDLAVDGGASTPVSAVNPLPVTNASLPLPAGASTSAKQDTGNTSVASIDTKTPALGQALAAASRPVVLTAIQQAALTPPAAITGFALEAGHLAAIDTSVAKIPSQGQALAAASVPVVLTAIQQAALTPPAAIAGFALEAGHLAAIDTSVAKIPSQGQALAAASVPVVLTAIQQAALTPPAAITGFATETTLAGRLKPADTLAGVTTVAAVTAITNALPAGTNKIGTVDIATAAAVAKGTQGANGVPTQDLKDSGRVNIMWTVEFSPVAVAEALLTMTESRDGGAVTTFTTKVVTTGKRLRITSWTVTSENTLGANPKRNKIRMKFNTAGAVTTASPLQANLVSSVATAVNTVGVPATDDFPDGIEFLGDGTKQIGFTNESPDWVTAAQTSKIYLTIFAFEY